MNIIVNNVLWDTDGQAAELPVCPILILNAPVDGAEELDDLIGDLLTDTYGWCHKGFGYSDAKDKDQNTLNEVKHIIRFPVF